MRYELIDVQFIRERGGIVSLNCFDEDSELMDLEQKGLDYNK